MARAARSGQSLSEFVLQELSELAGRPTISELTDRIRDRGSYTPGVGAADVLAALPAARWSSEPLLPRLWALRSNMTAYDATYVALAEGVQATLLTADVHLVCAAEQYGQCSVELVDARAGR